MVQDQIDLLGQLLVELSDDRLDRLDDIAADQLRLRERLLGERPNGSLDRLLRLVGLRLEFFSQQRIEFRDFNGSPMRLCVLLGLGSAMAVLRSAIHRLRRRLVLRVLGRRERLQERGILQQLVTSSSAPLLPSM